IRGPLLRALWVATRLPHFRGPWLCVPPSQAVCLWHLTALARDVSTPRVATLSGVDTCASRAGHGSGRAIGPPRDPQRELLWLLPAAVRATAVGRRRTVRRTGAGLHPVGFRQGEHIARRGYGRSECVAGRALTRNGQSRGLGVAEARLLGLDRRQAAVRVVAA